MMMMKKNMKIQMIAEEDEDGEIDQDGNDEKGDDKDSR